MLFVNNEFFAGIREVEDSKIYAIFPGLSYPPPGKEKLIYDFGWQPGKTLYYEKFEEEGLIKLVTVGEHIDSVLLLDGKYYKRIGEIIRGIESTGGFFISTFPLPTDGSQFTLLCFHIDGVLVYRNPNYASCDITTNVLATSEGGEIKLYPNPSNDFMTVEFPESFNIDTFKIFDVKGVLIKTYNVKWKSRLELDVRDLARGVYVYSAISKNNQKVSGKIVVK